MTYNTKNLHTSSGSPIFFIFAYKPNAIRVCVRLFQNEKRTEHTHRKKK